MMMQIPGIFFCMKFKNENMNMNMKNIEYEDFWHRACSIMQLFSNAKWSLQFWDCWWFWHQFSCSIPVKIFIILVGPNLQKWQFPIFPICKKKTQTNAEIITIFPSFGLCKNANYAIRIFPATLFGDISRNWQINHCHFVSLHYLLVSHFLAYFKFLGIFLKKRYCFAVPSCVLVECEYMSKTYAPHCIENSVA